MASFVMPSEQMNEMLPARGRDREIAVHNRRKFEEQRMRRRGTPEMFFTRHIDNTRLVKEDDPVRRREMRRFTVAMSFLFLFTMVYVWQHLSAIETGYTVEAQKQLVLKLEETNRQLHLQEAYATEPARVDVLARQLGLGESQPGQILQPATTGVVDAKVIELAQPAALQQ
jgi:hypothetical protein